MCASLTCSDLTECSARVPAKIPDARLRRERRLARSMERRPTQSIRTPYRSELQSFLYGSAAAVRAWQQHVSVRVLCARILPA